MSTHLLQRLLAVRRRSVDLIAPLEAEDLCLQGMADASPPKWHLGHTTWFFEQFLLQPLLQPLPHEPLVCRRVFERHVQPLIEGDHTGVIIPQPTQHERRRQ